MHALRNDYLFPLEHKYLYGIEKYLAGVKSYQAFIRHGNIACFHNDITLVTEEKGLEYIKQMIEIIAILKDRLRPD
jgi:hypothetical protein